MNVLGLSAFYHESACCLLRDGRLVAAAAEERFSRIKHDASLPVEAYRFCLDHAGLGPGDLDCVAYYESPELKLDRQVATGTVLDPGDPRSDPERPQRAIRELLGFEGKILTFEHHRSHAASAYFFSGMEEAAIFTVDGVGEWATTTYGQGRGREIELFEEVRFPHSLGLLYATVTSYLGFRVNGGEYKVMGLAAYGEPRYAGEVRRLLRSGPGGSFSLAMEYFDFTGGGPMFTGAFRDLFGAPPRRPESEINVFHRDLARSLQLVLEETLLEKADYLARSTGSRNLAMAGGVALNCVAVGRLTREGPFERVFVQPAAGDAGACLGAAALAHLELTGRAPQAEPLRDVFLGPEQTPDEIASVLRATGVEALDFRGRDADLIAAVADLIAGGRTIGWLHGRMELGPRALGGRSILASPLDPEMRDRLNRAVKKREAFRPFAPSVLASRAGEHFELDHPSPFMLEACRVSSPLDLPAITHVDDSARPQTVDAETSPRFAALIEAFESRTGCPLLLNTSLNLRGEPIVCDAVDALFCLGSSELDALVLEDFLIDRERLPEEWAALLPDWRGKSLDPYGEPHYTFV